LNIRSRTGWCALVWLVLLWALTQLSACVTRAEAPGASASRSGPVTDSDEPEARRRARLRLELASGYFEQGQTTFALDEVKQALAADPNYADAHNLRALIFTRLNEFSIAEESFKSALSLSPGEPDIAHNYAWLLCQRGRYNEATVYFAQALANANYRARPKTLMAQGLCNMRAGDLAGAETNLMRAYELDAANPVTGYNLAALMYARQDFARAQFYIRRINNTEFANAESLWLGAKVERKMQNPQGLIQLGEQLKKRFPLAKETVSYERAAYDE